MKRNIKQIEKNKKFNGEEQQLTSINFINIFGNNFDELVKEAKILLKAKISHLKILNYLNDHKASYLNAMICLKYIRAFRDIDKYRDVYISIEGINGFRAIIIEGIKTFLANANNMLEYFTKIAAANDIYLKTDLFFKLRHIILTVENFYEENILFLKKNRSVNRERRSFKKEYGMQLKKNDFTKKTKNDLNIRNKLLRSMIGVDLLREMYQMLDNANNPVITEITIIREYCNDVLKLCKKINQYKTLNYDDYAQKNEENINVILQQINQIEQGCKLQCSLKDALKYFVEYVSGEKQKAEKILKQVKYLDKLKANKINKNITSLNADGLDIDSNKIKEEKEITERKEVKVISSKDAPFQTKNEGSPENACLKEELLVNELSNTNNAAIIDINNENIVNENKKPLEQNPHLILHKYHLARKKNQPITTTSSHENDSQKELLSNNTCFLDKCLNEKQKKFLKIVFASISSDVLNKKELNKVKIKFKDICDLVIATKGKVFQSGGSTTIKIRWTDKKNSSICFFEDFTSISENEEKIVAKTANFTAHCHSFKNGLVPMLYVKQFAKAFYKFFGEKELSALGILCKDISFSNEEFNKQEQAKKHLCKDKNNGKQVSKNTLLKSTNNNAPTKLSRKKGKKGNKGKKRKKNKYK